MIEIIRCERNRERDREKESVPWLKLVSAVHNLVSWCLTPDFLSVSLIAPMVDKIFYFKY